MLREAKIVKGDAGVFSDETRRTVIAKTSEQSCEDILIEEFGQKFRDYRTIFNMATNFELVTGVPTHIDFELNYSCNLRCPMCPQGDPEATVPSYKGQVLPFDVYAKVVEEGVSKGLKSTRYNQLNEPLIVRDLPKYIAFARDKGVLDLALNTNAMLLDERWSRSLIEAGLTQLRVSIDAATSKTYDVVRVGGKYERVVENTKAFVAMRNAMGRRIPVVRVSMVLTKDNEHEVDLFVDQWRDVVDSYAISHMENWNAKSSNPMKLYGLNRPHNREVFRCPQPWQRATIYANGDFIPCCAEYRRHDPVANVKHKTLEELWHDEYVKKLRLLHLKGEWAKDPICTSCVTCGEK